MQEACFGSGYCCRLAIVSLRFDLFIILEHDTYDSNPYDPVGRVVVGTTAARISTRHVPEKSKCRGSPASR